MDPSSLSGRLLALAPALWVGLVAGLVLAALARWYDRVPVRVALGFFLAVALLYGEVLAGGAVLLPLDNLRGDVPFLDLAPSEPHGNLLQGDLLYLIHPARRAVRRAGAAGEWPLWNPRIGAGMPLLADPQAQALQPVTAVGEGPLPATAGPAAVAALRTFLALVFSFLLLRRLGAGRGPATAGALAYGLGGFLQLWIGWPLANTAALLPAVLYALVRTDGPSGRGLRRDWALLVVAASTLLLAGHPETIAYALAVTGLFAAARLSARPRGERLPWAGRLLGAFALAVLLASPALLPFAEILPGTLRWARLHDARSTTVTGVAGVAGTQDARAGEDGGATPSGPAETGVPRGTRRADFAPGADLRRAPATRLAQAIAPNSLGNSRFIQYWGLRNSNEDAAGFVGTATLLAALMAALLALTERADRVGRAARLRRSSLAVRLGRERPPPAGLRHEGLALALTAGAALLLALPAGFPLLPGALTAALSSGPLRVPPGGLSGRLTLVLDLGLALAAASGIERLRRAAPARWLRWGGPAVLALALAGFHLWAYAALRSPDDPAALDVLRWGWVHWHLRFALLGALVLALGAGRRWLGPAVALLVGAELVLAFGSANPPMPARLAFPSPPALAFLEQHARTGGDPRAGASEADERSGRVAGAGKALLPNLASIYGLADVRVFNPLAPVRYARLLSPAIATWDGEIPLLDGADHRPLYDRLGVRWLLLPPASPCPDGTETAFEDRSGRLCRRPGAHSVVRVVATGGPVPVPLPVDLHRSPGGTRWTARLASSPTSEPGSASTRGSGPATGLGAAPSSTAALDGPGRRLETGISASPGWRLLTAAADGITASRLRDAPLLAADLPAGARRADLLYRPVGFVAGMLLAALGLALLMAWAVAPPR